MGHHPISSLDEEVMRGRSPTQDTSGATKFMTSPRYYEEDEPHWKTVAAPNMTQLYDHSCRQVTQPFEPHFPNRGEQLQSQL